MWFHLDSHFIGLSHLCDWTGKDLISRVKMNSLKYRLLAVCKREHFCMGHSGHSVHSYYTAIRIIREKSCKLRKYDY